MAKMKAYLDPQMPFGISRQGSFYGSPIEIDENAVLWCEQLRDIGTEHYKKLDSMTFPANAQELADWLHAELACIMKTQKRRPKNVGSEDSE